MRTTKRLYFHTLLAALTMVFFIAVAACARPDNDVQTGQQEQQQAAPMTAEKPAPAAEAQAAPEPIQVAQAQQNDQAAKAKEESAEPDNPYAVEIEPLSLAQCGQCHPTYFKSLRNKGAGHQFDCRECHEVFHAYNPKKQNWDQIMPDCANCHDLPHGEKHAQCLNCHVNPHAPLNIPYDGGSPVTEACKECHSSPAKQLEQFPSQHTEVGCVSCHHDQHGYVPSCFECHGPHFEGQELESCSQCHPVHKPLQMTFTATTGAETCDACHGNVYTEWKQTSSKHGQVNCTVCHTEHGFIPECTSCHADPHSENLLSKFPNCLTCHLNPHDLPIKRKN